MHHFVFHLFVCPLLTCLFSAWSAWLSPKHTELQSYSFSRFIFPVSMRKKEKSVIFKVQSFIILQHKLVQQNTSCSSVMLHSKQKLLLWWNAGNNNHYWIKEADSCLKDLDLDYAHSKVHLCSCMALLPVDLYCQGASQYVQLV